MRKTIFLVASMVLILGVLIFTLNAQKKQQRIPPLAPITASAPILVPPPEGWKTYSNTDDGFSIHYPSDWLVRIATTTGRSAVILNSSENEASTYREKAQDISVDYYEDIGTYGKQFGRELSNLEDVVLEKRPKDDPYKMLAYVDMKPLVFAGVRAYEGIKIGFDAYYVVVLEKDSHIYEIYFGNRQSKESLTDVERQILNSFTLIE